MHRFRGKKTPRRESIKSQDPTLGEYLGEEQSLMCLRMSDLGKSYRKMRQECLRIGARLPGPF